MDKKRCLILGAESVDSNSLNRCLANLYDLTDEMCSKTMEMTSDNIPTSPFFSGGYQNALTDIDYVSSITFVQDGASFATPVTSASSAEHGVAKRTYGGSLQKCLTINDSFATDTVTGVYHYTEDDVGGFVPTVGTLFTTDAPLAFTSVIDDDTSTITTGVSALGCQSTPTVKFTSYMVCGYTGISFGQITFKRKNSDVQNNVVSLNITRDLINRDDVDEIKFFSVSNGYDSGVRRVSENLDMVCDVNTCNVTYTSGDDVIISNITKNDSSDTIRIDKDTGRILDPDEVRGYGEYTEISNDTASLNFFVVFSTRKDYVEFGESTWCFYLCDSYDYAKKSLTKADSYARGSINYRFDGFEAADDGYEDYLSDSPHKVYNTIKSSKDAFRGCFNATFSSLSHFSSAYEYADRMFKDCHHATFDSLPTCAYLPRLKTAVSMFDNCASAGFADLEHIHFPRATKLTKMFNKCTSAMFSRLETIDVNGSCGQMFYGDCSAEFKRLEEIRGGANVLDSMFEGCANADFCELKSITSSADGVVRAYSTFSGLSGNGFGKLERIDLGKECYNSNEMFRDCSLATFGSLTSIGEPRVAEYQFYGCRSASFSGVSSLGSHLMDGQHMFQYCSSMDMDIATDLDALNNSTEMFDHAGKVVLRGSMDSLVIADRMCSNMDYAELFGDMDSLQSARSAFVNTSAAYVYGSVKSLYDADSMFMNTGEALMQHVPSSLMFMLNMFSNSESCCVYDFQEAVAREFPDSTVQNRICDSAFANATSVAITGNIIAGDIESASNMFMDAGSVRLFNDTMDSATDAKHRYFYYGENMSYTVTVDLTSGLTRLYSKMSIEDIQTEDRKNTFALNVQITDDKTEYKMYLTDSAAASATVDEDDYDYTAEAYSAFGSNGAQYYFSEAAFLGGEAWTVNEAVGGAISFKFNVESSTNFTEDGNGSPVVGSKVVRYLAKDDDGKLVEISDFVFTSEKIDGRNVLKMKPSAGDTVVVLAGMLALDFELAIDYVVNGDDVDAVVTASETGGQGSHNSYRMHKDGTAHWFDMDSFKSELMIGDSSPSISAKLYQVYQDAWKTAAFAFMIAMRERDSLNTKYYLYKGGYDERRVDFTVEQGDLYSLDVVLDGSGSGLEDVKVEFGVDIDALGAEATFVEADEMFRGVVSPSLLSGYDCILSKSLVTTRGMFMLDERVEGDQTFKDTGRVFMLLGKAAVTDSSEMFLNRVVCDPYAFYDYGSDADRHYSLQVPLGVENAERMFCNCSISADGRELGLRIPQTLVKATSMLDGFSGGLVRLGYNSSESVSLNGGIEYENMFRGVKFANTERFNYTLTVPRISMSVFRGSDFLFNSVDHIVAADGRYYAPVNMSAGQRHELDNGEKIFETDAPGGAELGSLYDDLSKWFDEGVYLATVLGPSGDRYRFQTEYLTSGRMRGHYMMASASASADLISLSETTMNFRAANMSEICGERIASMFCPTLAASFSEETVGDAMVGLMEPREFESLHGRVESHAGRSYRSAAFNKVSKIAPIEMPFAFYGLSGGVFANVSTIEGGIVNAAGAFMDCKAATFRTLKSISISDAPAIGTFESAYTDMSSTSGEKWSGNYIDMFANDESAKFSALESVLVKSRFFRLYPINEHLDEQWFDFPSESGDAFDFGSRNVYRFQFLGPDGDGCAAFSIANEGGESIAEFRTSVRIAGGARVHLIEMDVASSPCVEVRVSKTDGDAETIYDRWLVYRNGDVIAGAETDPKPEYYYSNYLMTHFTTDERGKAFLNFDVKYVGEATSHKVYVAPDEYYPGLLDVVFEDNADAGRKTVYRTSIPSSAQFDFAVEFGEINTTETTSEIDYRLAVIVMLTVGGRRTYFTAKRDGDGFEIQESDIHPASNDYDNKNRETFDLGKCAGRTVVFGQNKYYVRFATTGGGTLSFSVSDSDGNEIAAFDTGVPSDGEGSASKVELIETKMYNDDSGENEDVVVIDFKGADFAYIAYANGAVSETTQFSQNVRYRYLCSYSDIDRYLSENSSYCDGMFMNCGAATFANLKNVSLAGTGSCSKMFAGCTGASISDLESLYLPVAYTTSKDADGNDDGGACCYRGLFSGCTSANVDLSSLDALTTNIYGLGYGSTKTKGRELFSGMGPEISSAADALAYLGLKLEIGDLMDWS